MKTDMMKICAAGIVLLMLAIVPIQATTVIKNTNTVNTGSSGKQIIATQAEKLALPPQNLNGQSNPVYNNDSFRGDFILPPWGGGMVHCTPQMTDNIRLPAPTSNVGVVWYKHTLGGELTGTWGNGIAGNGRIAACTFTNYPGADNLIIYDYDGTQLWSSGNLFNDSGLNSLATASTPMVDIHDMVVACDNWKIILVNASNHNNIHLEWNSTIPHEFLHPLKPIPFSPSIVENRTIILPTKGGPLLAYDVRTGGKIAEVRLGQDGVSTPYYGIPDMPTSDFESIISNPLSCPYHYNSQNHIIEWVAPVPFGLMPSNYIFYEGNIGFATSPDGIVSAFDNTTGEELASNAIEPPQLLQGGDYYSTINSACVKGNRIFLACEKDGNRTGRLYAVDVHPDAVPSDRLHVAWYFNYSGKSQASPTLIGNTIYFDGYNDSKWYCPEPKDPHIYAVYIANGTKKWSVKYNFTTWFSFSMDPRGGFWYEESGIFGDTGQNVTHFNQENGAVIEKINISRLINDPGLFPIIPCSCMTMCGTETNPIMLISANRHCVIPSIPGKWVAAIDLANNNNLLWKVRLDPFLLLSHHSNYANGQYTILMNNHNSRVLFGTWLGGVYALGSTDGSQGDSLPGGLQNAQDVGSNSVAIGSSSLLMNQQSERNGESKNLNNI